MPQRTSDQAESRAPQSVGEEIANSACHGIGLLAGIAVLPCLIVKAASVGTIMSIVSASVFGATVILLYLNSTIYHAVTHETAKRIFRILDHAAIYLLIAGTYTPFMLAVVGGALGWTLFGVIWGLALAGVILVATMGVRHSLASTIMYVLMGWLVVGSIRPLWLNLPTPSLAGLFAGGVLYTLGAAVYSMKRIRYTHFIWHLFVLAGTAAHVYAVWHSIGGHAQTLPTS